MAAKKPSPAECERALGGHCWEYVNRFVAGKPKLQQCRHCGVESWLEYNEPRPPR